MAYSHVRWLDETTNEDVDQVGGKNAPVGEMPQRLRDRRIQAPNGFPTTTAAYLRFMQANDLDEHVAAHVDDLRSGTDLAEVGATIRTLFLLEDHGFRSSRGGALGRCAADGAHRRRRRRRHVQRRHPLLVFNGIDSISVTPDSCPRVKDNLASAEEASAR